MGGSTDSESRTRALSVISNLLTHSNQLSSDTEKQIIAVIRPIVASLEDGNINLNVQAARTLKCISAAVRSSKSELTKYGALSKMRECSRRCSELQYTARPAHCSLRCTCKSRLICRFVRNLTNKNTTTIE